MKFQKNAIIFIIILLIMNTISIAYIINELRILRGLIGYIMEDTIFIRDILPRLN